MGGNETGGITAYSELSGSAKINEDFLGPAHGDAPLRDIVLDGGIQTEADFLFERETIAVEIRGSPLIEISGSLDFAPVRNTVGVGINRVVKVMSDCHRIDKQFELHLVEGLSIGVVHSGAIDGPVGKSVIS